MILILVPNTQPDSPEYKQLMSRLDALPGISTRIHKETGTEQSLTEVYLIGNTKALSIEEVSGFPCVDHVVRVSEEYRVLGRHKDDDRPTHFTYNGVHFGQDTLNVFAGLCAVDTLEHVEMMMKALRENNQVCTRMGAYKPRTSPYAFQGHGKSCLPYVFELAGKYGIKVIAMEITHESHLEEIRNSLFRTGNPTGVILQIGTRNTQNFELLKIVGKQQDFPVLIKRGFGITLDESLNAAEYLASEGNRKVIFGLRGMKTNMGDPSHSVGTRAASPDGLLDIMHATAQGIIAGANMVLVDFHPVPNKALVDGPQALLMKELPQFLEDIQLVRETYEKRVALAQRYQEQ